AFLSRVGGPWQRVAARGSDAVARIDRVAEAAAAPRIAGDVHAVRLGAMEAGKARSKLRKLVAVVVPLERREVVCELLHAKDVEVRERARGAHDAAEVDDAVDPAAPLDVPGDEFHGKFAAIVCPRA